MSYAQNGTTRLYYETFGDRGDPAVLLLNGAGRQCVDFAEGFCQRIAGEGFRVIRYDSRDTGLSTAFPERPARLLDVYAAVLEGRPPPLAYGLDDMAKDALAVLDAAEESKAHLLGRSIGGMAAQLIALDAPTRVLSLTLIMSNSRSVAGGFSKERLEALEAEVVATEEDFVARQLRTAKVIASPSYLDEARIAAEARVAWSRGVHVGAVARHFAVGLAAPDLRDALGRVAAPTLVVHGALDPLIPLSFAKETAAAIPGARLEIMSDMAHDAPPELWRRWADMFVAHAGPSSSISAQACS